MLRIGIMGAGHLGKIHIKCIQQIPEYKFIGFFDPDQENAKKVAAEYNTHSFASIEELIDEVDVVDIVTPTLSHFDCAAKALKRGKHVFIEKPIAASAAEAQQMIVLSNDANVKVQVGHVERFNPAFTAAVNFIDNPMFIETHRLAQFNPRGTDVPVILDLMIHDIDIVLSVVKSKVSKISASGVKVVSDTPDIANARIEFENGCVANLTASRISMKNMRKSRFFQRDAYIAVDFLDKTTEIVRMKEVNPEENDPFAMIIELGENKGSKQIFFEKPDIQAINAIKMELETFYHAIVNDTTPIVSIIDGYNALDVAYQIIDKLND
ncbi:MAG: Gfo/Idh/MocA family oxidoreductase [Bacteroidota bacterium]